MKITGLETVLLTAQPSEPIRWSGGQLNTVQASLILVHTDENITGLGETYTGIFAPKAVRGIVESLEPLLLGEDPTDVARLYQKMYSKTLFWARVGAGLSTIGAIETALWDILGKVKGEPVEFNARWANTYIRQDGRWKIRMETVIPSPPPAK